MFFLIFVSVPSLHGEIYENSHGNFHGNFPREWEIYVQAHRVAFCFYHASILIIPRNQGKYEQDPRFQNTFVFDGDLRRYGTLGAGFGTNRLLVSNINRVKDKKLSIKVEFAPVDLEGADADDIIAALFEKDSFYNDDIDYDMFPAKTEAEQRWYLADDGYNSNSYVCGCQAVFIDNCMIIGIIFDQEGGFHLQHKIGVSRNHGQIGEALPYNPMI